MRFLIDAQLPSALASLFVNARQEAVHVRDVGLLAANDAEIAAYPAKADGNATNRVVGTRMRPLMPEILAALAAGEEIIEVR